MPETQAHSSQGEQDLHVLLFPLTEACLYLKAPQLRFDLRPSLSQVFAKVCLCGCSAFQVAAPESRL